MRLENLLIELKDLLEKGIFNLFLSKYKLMYYLKYIRFILIIQLNFQK